MANRFFAALMLWCALVAPADTAQPEVLKRGDVAIIYEPGMKSAALEVLGSIPSIRKHIEERTGLTVDFRFDVVVFRNRDDFVRQAGNDMIAAFAVPGEGRIVLDLSQMSVHPLNIELISMHEMTHLVLHHNIERANLPKWFDEGISEWVSGISEIINPEKTNALKKAVIGNKLIPLYRLRHSFPDTRDGFLLAYQQSRSIVEFIERKYGEHALQGIMGRLSNGEGFNDAVRHELSEIVTEIEREWKSSLRTQYTWLGYVSNNIQWIVFVAAALITTIGFLRLRKRIRDYPDDEEDEYLENILREDVHDDTK